MAAEVFSGRKILHILNQLIFLEKKNILEFDGISLYPSEIHLMLVISRDLPTNATRMAERLGITKGAISQTLTRLEKKGMLHKEKDPFNKNELTVSLTPQGMEAYDRYQKVHASLLNKVDSYLSSLSESEKEVIGKFFLHFEKVLKMMQ